MNSTTLQTPTEAPNAARVVVTRNFNKRSATDPKYQFRPIDGAFGDYKGIESAVLREVRFTDTQGESFESESAAGCKMAAVGSMVEGEIVPDLQGLEKVSYKDGWFHGETENFLFGLTLLVLTPDGMFGKP